MTYSPVWVVGSGQSGRVQGGDALAVDGAWPFNPAAQDVVDAAAGQTDHAANLAVGPTSRQQLAQVADGVVIGLRCASHGDTVARSKRLRKRHKLTIADKIVK